MIIYQVFVRSFADGNQDGIGDLIGLRQKLTYIKEMGATAIWLSPIHPSPSYHKYDVTNYFDIDPEFGTIDDLKQLIKAAHKIGLKIILDLVLNHCSAQHSWFTEALNQNAETKDFFLWKRRDELNDTNKEKEALTADSDNKTLWHQHPKSPDLFYYAYFWSEMPNLNYANAQVVANALNIAHFWLNLGVDGFRLDAALHLFPEEQLDQTIAFWEQFKSELQAKFSEIILVGEVWTDTETIGRFSQGFTHLFHFDLSYGIKHTLQSKAMVKPNPHSWKAEEKDTPAGHVLALQQALTKSECQMATFLSNHDQNRLASELKHSFPKLRLAINILMTLPGTPVIYYGEEIGMKGMKPDEYIREPMVWLDNCYTEWIQPLYNQIENFDFEASEKLSKHYHEIIKLRHQNPSWENCQIRPLSVDDDTLMIYELKTEADRFMMIHNLSSRQKMFRLDDRYYPIYGLEEDKKDLKYWRIAGYHSLVLQHL